MQRRSEDSWTRALGLSVYVCWREELNLFPTQNSRQRLSDSEQKLSKPSASMNWKYSCYGDAVAAPELGHVADLGSAFAYGSPPVSPRMHLLAHGCAWPTVASGSLLETGSCAASWCGCFNTQSAPTTGDAHPLQEHAGNNVRDSIPWHTAFKGCCWRGFEMDPLLHCLKWRLEVSWVQSWTCLPHETLFLPCSYTHRRSGPHFVPGKE